MASVAAATSLHVPLGPEIPQWLPADVPVHQRSPAHLAPTHLLAVTAPDAQRTLLLPVHGLLFAAMSRALSIISCAPHLQPSFGQHPNLPRRPAPQVVQHPPRPPSSRRIMLPVVPLNMPSVAAFPLLQSWVYLRDPAVILAALVSTARVLQPTLVLTAFIAASYASHSLGLAAASAEPTGCGCSRRQPGTSGPSRAYAESLPRAQPLVSSECQFSEAFASYSHFSPQARRGGA